MPTERIQRMRKKGCVNPHGSIYVGRPGYWGNPHKVSEQVSPSKAVSLYRIYILQKLKFAPARQELLKLRGMKLSCFCSQNAPCHADVLCELADLPDGELDELISLEADPVCDRVGSLEDTVVIRISFSRSDWTKYLVTFAKKELGDKLTPSQHIAVLVGKFANGSS